MDSAKNIDECQLWINEDNAPAPFVGTGVHNQRRQKRSVAVCSMNMGSPKVSDDSMTTRYRIPSRTVFPPPNEDRFKFPSPQIGGRLRVPVNLNVGARKSVGTGVFIPTGRRRNVGSTSFKNNETYIVRNEAPVPQIEKKTVKVDVMEEDVVENKEEEDVIDIELLLPAEWVY